MSRPTILITGASTGIGEALVRHLVGKFVNPRFILASRNVGRLRQLANQLSSQLNTKSEVLALECDVSNKKSVERLIEKSYRKFKVIDVFVLNAGVSMWQSFKEIEQIDILETIMKTNYLGVVYPLHFAFKRILRDRSKIIVVSSAQSFIPLPYHSGYVASKYAVNGFLDTLRQEEKGVSITEIMFGWVRGTDLRKNALGKKNLKASKSSKKTSKKNLFAVELTEAIDVITKAFYSKKKVVFSPPIIGIIPIVKVFLPRLLYRIIRKITRGEAKR